MAAALGSFARMRSSGRRTLGQSGLPPRGCTKNWRSLRQWQCPACGGRCYCNPHTCGRCTQTHAAVKATATAAAAARVAPCSLLGSRSRSYTFAPRTRRQSWDRVRSTGGGRHSRTRHSSARSKCTAPVEAEAEAAATAERAATCSPRYTDCTW